MTDQPPEEKPAEAPAPPQQDDAQKQCIVFWEEFKKKCATVGKKPVPVTNLQQAVADSINQRERNLVQWIVNTYTQAQVVFNPAGAQRKPEGPKEEKPDEKPKKKEEPKKK